MSQLRGKKVLISVGGWNEGVADFRSIAGNSAYRTTFANSLAGIVSTYGLDGVDTESSPPLTASNRSVVRVADQLLPSTVQIVAGGAQIAQFLGNLYLIVGWGGRNLRFCAAFAPVALIYLWILNWALAAH